MGKIDMVNCISFQPLKTPGQPAEPTNSMVPNAQMIFSAVPAKLCSVAGNKSTARTITVVNALCVIYIDRYRVSQKEEPNGT